MKTKKSIHSILLIFVVMLVAILAVMLAACGDDNAKGKSIDEAPKAQLWTATEAYAAAVDEGWEGTFAEFLARLSNISGVQVNESGNLIVSLGDGQTTVDAGKVVGEKGEAGVGIMSITLTDTNTVTNINTYTITFTDESTSTFSVQNGKDGKDGKSVTVTQTIDKRSVVISQDGKTYTIDSGEDGRGIVGVESELDEDGKNVTLTITYDSGDPSEVKVPVNKGIMGIECLPGQAESIYRITYTDGTTYDITIKNGAKGEQGKQGEKGETGASAYQLYKAEHPAYVGTQSEWLQDLAEGKLSSKYIEVTEVSSFDDLKTAIAEGKAYIRLTRNLYNSDYEDLTITCKDYDIKCVLDLNGFKLGAELNIKSAYSANQVHYEQSDTGKYRLDGDKYVAIKSDETFAAEERYKQIIDIPKGTPYENEIDIKLINGSIGFNSTECYYGIFVSSGSTDKATETFVNNKVYLKNVSSKAYYGGFYTNGGLSGGAEVVADNCTFEAIANVGSMFIAGYNKYTFNSCIFNGGVYTKSGNITFNDCEINGLYDYEEPSYHGSGAKGVGSALIIDSTEGYYTNLNVTINGGVLSSESGYGIEAVAFVKEKSDATPQHYSTINIVNSPAYAAPMRSRVVVFSEDELNGAIAGDWEVISLGMDIVTKAGFVLDRNVVIDLNGRTISKDYDNGDNATYREYVFRVVNEDTEKEFTAMIANGNIIADGTCEAIYAIQVIGEYANAIVNGVNIESNGWGVTVFNDASVDVDGCNIQAQWHAIGTNNLMGTAVINVESSMIESTADAAIFISGFSTITINSSTVKGGNAMHIMMGDITVKNSTLESIETIYSPYTIANITKNGTLEHEGSVIVIRADLYYDSNELTNKLVLNIDNSNQFVGETGVAVSLYDCNDAKTNLANKKNVCDQSAIAEKFCQELEDRELIVKRYVYENGELKKIVEEK